MSRLGFRFAHATCLSLDEHLAGTGSLPLEDREIAEDATFGAWDGVVNTAIAAQVDFLILAGNSFNARTNSLRARVALEKGFEKLAAHDISVFIAAGVLDPASAWKRNIHLPPNVTLLGGEDQEPVAVLRDHQVLAQIYVVASAEAGESLWNSSGPGAMQRSDGQFRIGLIPAGTPVRWQSGRPVAWEGPGQNSLAAGLVQAAIDHRTNYLALGEGRPLTEYAQHTLVHDPGCAQALSGTVTGSRGCSVVEVGSNGEVRVDPVAIAPVRWEQVDLTIEAHTNWNDLVERMALAMMERVADNDERLWIVNWRLAGTGTLFDSLASATKQNELWELVETELAGESEVRRAHRLERLNVTAAAALPLPVEDVAQGEAPILRAIPSGLLADFEALLEARGEAVFEQTRRELASHALLENPDGRAIREAAQQASRQRVLQRARALAGRWLG